LLKWFRPLKLNPKKENFITILLVDESGSMEIIKDETIALMKNTIKASVTAELQNPNQEHYCAVVSFEGSSFKPIIPMIKPVEIGNHLYEQYYPGGNTPLYDAIALTIRETEAALINCENYQLSFYIITDGEENASFNFNEKEIYDIIEAFKNKGWEFTFLGANIPVDEVASKININHHYTFQFSDEGVKELSNMVFKMQEEKFKRKRKNNRP
jgi:Mg-chelatase subunit ChlD